MTEATSIEAITQRLYTFHREAFYKIRPILPPPFEETAEGFAARDQAVIEAIVQLVPLNASETELAAMAVAGNQLWMHYMREARRNEADAKEHDRLTAQASRSGRDARGYLAALERLQKARISREATRESAERADMAEENSRRLMLAALADPPKGMQPPGVPPAAATQPGPAPRPEGDATALLAAPPQPPVSASEPEAGDARPAAAESATVLHLTPLPRVVAQPPKASRARARDDDDEPKFNWAEEAEFYAKIYPDRARLFRRLGRLPVNCDFGPPEDKLLRAIIAGTTPTLMALDAPNPVSDEKMRRYA